jgi:hypothetical protein
MSTETVTAELIRERREGAARFWRELPLDEEHVFDLRTFQAPAYYTFAGEGCGTAACAAGWLAIHEIDGWHWASGRMPGRDRINAYGSNVRDELAAYFGLAPGEANRIFYLTIDVVDPETGVSETERRYGVDVRLVTPAMVAEALLVAPIVLPEPAL